MFPIKSYKERKKKKAKKKESGVSLENMDIVLEEQMVSKGKVTPSPSSVYASVSLSSLFLVLQDAFFKHIYFFFFSCL